MEERTTDAASGKIAEALGFIGTGAITDALVRAISRSPDAPEMLVSRRSEGVSAALSREFSHVNVCGDNQEILDRCGTVFLAVRPQVAAEVVRPLRFHAGQKVVSLVATVAPEELASWIPQQVSIVRAIPFPFIKDGLGSTVVHPPDASLTELLRHGGGTIDVTEPSHFLLYSVGSALMGPYFGILETMQHWLEAQGLPAEDARHYLVSLHSGLTGTACGSDGSFSELREAFSTKGGINEDLYRVFQENGGNHALTAGLDAVHRRVSNSTAGPPDRKARQPH